MRQFNSDYLQAVQSRWPANHVPCLLSIVASATGGSGAWINVKRVLGPRRLVAQPTLEDSVSMQLVPGSAEHSDGNAMQPILDHLDTVKVKGTASWTNKKSWA